MTDEKNEKREILIVDDDTFLLNMYSVKFEKAGCKVNTSSSAIDALQKLRDGFRPAIIVLDLIMPVMTGFEFLEKVREEHLIDDAVVIILSNQGQPADLDAAKKLGVDGYIIKATTIPSEVLTQINEIYQSKKGKS